MFESSAYGAMLICVYIYIFTNKNTNKVPELVQTLHMNKYTSSKLNLFVCKNTVCCGGIFEEVFVALL
jgi:hypothetical protein